MTVPVLPNSRSSRQLHSAFLNSVLHVVYCVPQLRALRHEIGRSSYLWLAVTKVASVVVSFSEAGLVAACRNLSQLATSPGNW